MFGGHRGHVTPGSLCKQPLMIGQPIDKIVYAELDSHADHDTGERQPGFTLVEVVDTSENDGKCVEETEEDTEVEGDVDGKAANNRFFEQHSDRSEKGPR